MDDQAKAVDNTAEQVASEQPASKPENQVDSATDKKESNIGDAFSAVKKEYRQKGFNEGRDAGLQEGYERAKQELFSAEEPDAAQVTNHPQAQIQQPQVDQTAMRLQQRLNQIELDGCRRFEDFGEKVAPIAKKCEFDPELRQLCQTAALAGDEETLYMLSDDDARAKIMEKNLRLWQKELRKLKVKPKSANPKAVEPIQEIKTPPTAGGGQLTYADRLKRARLKLKGKTV